MEDYFSGDKSKIDEKEKHSFKTRDSVFGTSEVVEGNQAKDEKEKAN